MGEGVSELRVDYGPGYRVYFVGRGPDVVIRLAGGDKRTLDRDIGTALDLARQIQEVTMTLKTTVWDVAEHLKTNEDMAAYLDACLEEGDPALVATALGDIARARHVADCARYRARAGEPLQGAIS